MRLGETLKSEMYLPLLRSEQGKFFLAKRYPHLVDEIDSVGVEGHTEMFEFPHGPHSATYHVRLPLRVSSGRIKEIEFVLKEYPSVALGKSERLWHMEEEKAMLGFQEIYEANRDGNYQIPIHIGRIPGHAAFIREYIPGKNLVNRVLLIDEELKRLHSQLEFNREQQNIKEIDDIMKKIENLRKNKSNHVIAGCVTLADLLFKMNVNLPRFGELSQSLSTYFFTPTHDWLAGKCVDYVRKLVKSENGELKDKLEKLWLYYLDSSIYKSLREDNSMVILGDYHPKNIVLREDLDEELDPKFSESVVNPMEIAPKMCFVDLGALRKGPDKFDLADYLNFPEFNLSEEEIDDALTEYLKHKFSLAGRQLDLEEWTNISKRNRSEYRLSESLRLLRAAANETNPERRDKYLALLGQKRNSKPEVREFVDIVFDILRLDSGLKSVINSA